MDAMDLVVKSYFKCKAENIDVREKVMSEISDDKTIKKKYKMGFFILGFSLMLLLLTGFVANSLLEIRNEKGELIWNFNQVVYEEGYATDADIVFKTLNISEGEGVEIYTTFNNPDKITLLRQEPFKLKKTEDLTNEMTNFMLINIQNEFLNQYVLDHILVNHYYEHLSEEEYFSLIREGDNSEKGIAYHKAKRLDTISGITAVYYSENRMLQITEMDWVGNNIYGYLENEEIIQLQDIEVIYSYTNGYHDIIWIEAGKMINVLLEGEKMNREEIVNIVAEIR